MSSSPRRGKQPVASRSDGAGASARSTTAAPAEQSSAPKPSLSRWGLALLIGLALLAVLIVLSGAVGSRMFSFEKALDGFLHPDAATIESKLIWFKRMPRTLAAIMVGAALAVAGVIMQALSRNPLAEPGLLGVNSGAAVAVVVGVGIFGVSSPFVQLWLALAGSGLAAARYSCWALSIPSRTWILPPAWCLRALR